jgi:hypothetical protein
MANDMPIYVEVWPVAADETGIWLVSASAPWTVGPVKSDEEPHAEVEYALSEHHALDGAALLHSTSWRVEDNYLLLTYMAVLQAPGLVLDSWREAKPVGLSLAEHVGPTLPYQPTDPPTPRYIDVLLHGLRHLKFLSETDATNAAALSGHWVTHLRNLQPALAGMYTSNLPNASRP